MGLLRYPRGSIKQPPGGYIYVHPEDGHVTEHVIHSEWLKECKRYRNINHYPVALDFDAQADHQDCSRKPPGWCVDSGTGVPQPAPVLDQTKKPKRRGITVREIWTGTKFFVDFLRSGSPKAAIQEIQTRAAICKTCEDNIAFKDDDPGCATCAATAFAHTVANLLTGVRQDQPVPGEESLGACYHCACSLKAMIRAPLDMLQKHTTEEVNKALPEHCWKKRS